MFIHQKGNILHTFLFLMLFRDREMYVLTCTFRCVWSFRPQSDLTAWSWYFWGFVLRKKVLQHKSQSRQNFIVLFKLCFCDRILN